MITKVCVVCGAQFEAQRASRKYCSHKCRTALYRQHKAEAAAARAPARAALVARLDRMGAPKTAAVAREVISEAGEDCTELIVKLIGQAADELGPLLARAKAKASPMGAAAGAPIK